MKTKPVRVKVRMQHDSGYQNYIAWACSLEEAKRSVCNSVYAPLRAVVYAKVCPMTIYDIKHDLSIYDPKNNFFSRGTMKFFGQTMKDFSVTRYGDSEFFISAKSWGGTTERIYNPFTKELRLP